MTRGSLTKDSYMVDTLDEANEVIRVLRDELAAVCVAVGRSKDGTGFDVDWFELHKDVEQMSTKLNGYRMRHGPA